MNSSRDATEICFLIRQLGAPDEISDGEDEAARRSLDRALAKTESLLGISLRLVSLDTLKGNPRRVFGFWFTGFLPSDAKAYSLGESLLYAATLLSHDVGEPADLEAIYRFPAKLMTADFHIALTDLEAYEESLPWSERSFEYAREHLFPVSQLSIGETIAAIRILPVLVQHRYLFRAAGFYTESIRLFAPDCSDETLEAEPVELPNLLQARVQSSFLNAFKALEAVTGPLPKDAEKIQRRISTRGVDPEFVPGFQDLRSSFQISQRLDKDRNSRVAHGGMPGRPLSLRDLCICQAAALHVLLAAVQQELGGPIVRLKPEYQAAMEYMRASRLQSLTKMARDG